MKALSIIIIVLMVIAIGAVTTLKLYDRMAESAEDIDTEESYMRVYTIFKWVAIGAISAAVICLLIQTFIPLV